MMKEQNYQTSKTHSEEKIAAKTAKKHRGICTTCLKSNQCKFQKDQREPIIFCDEFYSFLKETENFYCFTLVINSSELYKERYKGLCQFCENQINCTFPKPIWGIWQCEDYK